MKTYGFWSTCAGVVLVCTLTMPGLAASELNVLAAPNMRPVRRNWRRHLNVAEVRSCR